MFNEKIATEKSLIVAYRIKLKWVIDFIASIILSCLLISFLIFLPEMWILWFLILFIIVLYEIFNIIYCCNNNNLPNKYITYKDGNFNIYLEEETLTINKKDIYDLSYKNKKFYIATPYYYSSGEYNYGKLYIYVKDDNNINKLTLNNIANPNKVFDKMCELLEWNLDDE